MASLLVVRVDTTKGLILTFEYGKLNEKLFWNHSASWCREILRYQKYLDTTVCASITT